jgi:hypothetical protein
MKISKAGENGLFATTVFCCAKIARSTGPSLNPSPLRKSYDLVAIDSDFKSPSDLRRSVAQRVSAERDQISFSGGREAFTKRLPSPRTRWLLERMDSSPNNQRFVSGTRLGATWDTNFLPRSRIKSYHFRLDARRPIGRVDLPRQSTTSAPTARPGEISPCRFFGDSSRRVGSGPGALFTSPKCAFPSVV